MSNPRHSEFDLIPVLRERIKTLEAENKRLLGLINKDLETTEFSIREKLNNFSEFLQIKNNKAP